MWGSSMKKKVNEFSIHDLMMNNVKMPISSSVLDKIMEEKMNAKVEPAPKKENTTEKNTDSETAHVEEQKAEKKPHPVTKLVLYRHYTTYQGVFSIWPKEGTTMEDCFSKAILYVMKWFRSRLGDGDFEAYEELKGLQTDYPEPKDSRKFDIAKVGELRAQVLLDIHTLYRDDLKDWTFRLQEPDNNNDQSGMLGRTFVTNIFVRQEEKQVVLGVKVTCREPASNGGEASVYRPGFIKNMNEDGHLEMGEYGIPRKYSFTTGVFRLNGKSNQDCTEMFESLIDNKERQMPIVFCPVEYYEQNQVQMEGIAKSLLGFAHVVTVENGVNKLFGTNMNRQEYIDTIAQHQVILHKENHVFAEQVEPLYFDTEEETIQVQLQEFVKQEPKRKQFSFGTYQFYTEARKAYQKAELERRDKDSIYAARYEEEKEKRERLESDYHEVKQDIARLENKNQALQREVKKKDEAIRVISSEKDKQWKDMDQLRMELEQLKEKHEAAVTEVPDTTAIEENYKKIIKPLIDCPQYSSSIRSDVIAWIKKYYDDTLIVHPRAEKALADDNRNLDWKRLCLIIHYIAGYTVHLNEGGTTRDENIAREYDPMECAISVDNTSSGDSGATEIFKDKYTINISTWDSGKSDVILDKHVKYGKGQDSNMIRVYFYYDADIKKSIIGYMPDHLPTRKDSH